MAVIFRSNYYFRGDGELRRSDIVIKLMGVHVEYEDGVCHRMMGEGFSLIDLDSEPGFDKDAGVRIFFDESKDFVPIINNLFGLKAKQGGR